jgi:proteasome lid subunit RPN8/RPN11
MMASLGQTIEKVIFDIQVENSLKKLAMNYRPREAYAYLLGCLKLPQAYVYEFIHDALAESASVHIRPNTSYLLKAFNLKKSLLPGIRLDLLSWFHTHPIDYPSEHTDIPNQKRFKRVYKLSFATLMNYNTLEMRCFDVEGDKVRMIPYEVRSIPQVKNL